MGFGDYLSSQAEFEYTRAEHSAKWAGNYPEARSRRWWSSRARGKRSGCASVIEVMSKYKTFSWT